MKKSGRYTSNAEELPAEFSYLVKILNSIPQEDVPSSLVRSHHVPSDAERAVIKGKVTSMESHITTLKHEVDKLKAAVDAVKARLKSIKKCQKYERSLLSPIRKVPDEILSHIFSYVVGEIELCEVGGPIFDLKKVCWRWANVVETNPFLWRKFNVFSPGIVSPDVIALRIRQCLKLSRVGPLSIKLEDKSSKGLLAGKYLHLCLDEGHAMIGDLSLRNINDWECNLSMCHQWTMLKKLSISSHTFITWGLFTALPHMKSLEDLTLKNIGSGSISALTKIIQIKSLKSLRLENIVDLVYDYPIRMLRVPSLSELHIVQLSGDVSDNLDAIQDMIHTSNCSLQSLQLEVNTTPDDILSLLERVTGIKSLSLVGSSISEQVLASTPTILMNLDKLELDTEEYCESIDNILSCLRNAMMYYKTHLSRSLKVKCCLTEWEVIHYDQILKDLVKYGKEMMTDVTVAWYPDSESESES